MTDDSMIKAILEEVDSHIVTPQYDDAGISGLVYQPVLTWRLEGEVDHRRLIRVTQDGPVKAGLHALCLPDARFRLSDGECCDSEDDLVASFRRRGRNS